MTQRAVVEIDQEKCDGCGQCVPTCAEGAIKIIDGKARLVSDAYCDGLGACLGKCPRDAITIIQRDAAPFDEAAVRARHAPAACPGAAAHDLRLNVLPPIGARESGSPESAPADAASPLSHWPIQLHLISPAAPSLKEADLFLVADCVPFACAEFHHRILRNRPVVIGCPKLDDGRAYVQKLADIFRHSAPRSLTVVHMEVPCCTNLLRIAAEAMKAAGTTLPLEDITISRRGEILSR
jgi:Pyruvate/2-oxoacid:ferredoxin oxidoreductase delta subunit